MASLQRALVRLQPLVVVLALGFMALLLARQWESLLAHQWRFRPGWLAASGALMVAGWLIDVRLWQRLVHLLGGQLGFPAAVTVWFSSAIVRYIPGNIWQPLSITVLCLARGVRPEVTLASTFLLQGVHVLGVGVIVAAYIAMGGQPGAASPLASLSTWWAAAVAAPVVLFAIWPRPLLALGNYILARCGREPLPMRISTGQLLGLLGICLVEWIVLCASFTALVCGLAMPAGLTLWAAAPHVAAAYPVAYAIGRLTLLTPSGLAVREGVLFVLLRPILGSGNAIVAALALRVLEVGLEIVAGSLVLGLPWVARLRHPAPQEESQ